MNKHVYNSIQKLIEQEFIAVTRRIVNNSTQREINIIKDILFLFFLWNDYLLIVSKKRLLKSIIEGRSESP